MAQTIGFITSERDHICEVTRWLLSHVDGRFLFREGNPFKISVRGSQKSGKKIIADATHEYFFGQNGRTSGNPEYDEYTESETLSSAFVNVLWERSQYSHPALRLSQNQYGLTHEFLKAQSERNLLLIHNAVTSPDWADIDIWLYDQSDILYNTAHPSFRDNLRGIFGMANRLQPDGSTHEWPRVMRVIVRNEELLDDPVFQMGLRRFAKHADFSVDIEFSTHEADEDTTEDYLYYRSGLLKPRVHDAATPPEAWKNVPPQQP